MPGKRAARQDCPVLAAGRPVGHVTSGSYSPTLDKSIAMAYVAPEWARPGTELRIDIRGRMESAGAEAAIWWLQRWPNTAKRWPVPVGKDPGEAIKAGCNLRAWLIAGLPPVLTIGDHANLACNSQEGGAAVNSPSVAEKERNFDVDQCGEPVVDQVGRGAGDESKNIPAAGEEKEKAMVATPADSVTELRNLLRKTGIVVVKSENGANLTITGGRPDASADLKQQISSLVFQNDAVFAYINGLPDGRITVNG